MIYLNYLVFNQKLLSDFDIEFNYENECYIISDEKRISQVIYNFITNAINYSKDCKKIIVKQNIDFDKVTISVQDFGIGISKEDLELIWNRYYRVDKTHQRSIIGTGLGLSIVKEILDHYGYSYDVESIEGKGSIFSFEIPISK